MTKRNENDHGPEYPLLINAIVTQAIRDYKYAYRLGYKKRMLELEEFFRSEWFEILTDNSGNDLLKRLRGKL